MNAVFIHIPKTAGLTIQEALNLQLLRNNHRIKRSWKNKGMVTFGHQSYLRLVKIGIVNKQFNRDAFKFAFCRNPFDRAVSHYFYVLKKHPERMSRSISFLEMTRTLADYGRTYQPQSEYVRGIDLDFIGRFENLEVDLYVVANILGIKVNMLHLNATKHRHFSEYYNEESEANVRNFYKEDFERFGYDNRLLSLLKRA